MKIKKKFIIIAVMIFVCTGLFILSQKLQNTYLNNKVSNASQVQNKVASSGSIKPSEKVVSLSGQSKTNTATDIAKQNTGANKTVAKAAETQKATPKAVAPAATISASKPVAAKPQDKGPYNFRILDTINNKVIIEKNIDFDNVTVDFITCKLLNAAGIKYINEGEGSSTSYFNSIAGLAERKAGPVSGWCFYVNGKKPGIGVGGYNYHKGDKIEWKYLKDALNN